MSAFDPECKHGLTVSSCSLCLHPPKQERPPEPVATFAARYEGQCPSCDLPVMVGQIIHLMSDGTYRHAECG